MSFHTESHFIPKFTSYQKSLHTESHFIPKVTSYQNSLHTRSHFIPRPLHTKATSYQSLHTSATHTKVISYQCTLYRSLHTSVNWTVLKCQTGRSESFKLDCLKMSNWTVRKAPKWTVHKCQSGRSKSATVKADRKR